MLVLSALLGTKVTKNVNIAVLAFQGTQVCGRRRSKQICSGTRRKEVRECQRSLDVCFGPSKM